MAQDTFNPALIVVDLQEDFCPPNGSLAVAEGRDTAPIINDLLTRPAFRLRVATKDWHPSDHISFAANHPGKQPFVDVATVTNPLSSPDTPEAPYETRLWPVHCVQDTPGAQLIPELDTTKIDKILEKGQRKEVEMYSAFYDPFEHPRVSDSGLADLLHKTKTTHVYVVGVAADYCVRATAIDAAKEGFTTYIVAEGTRPVDPAAWIEIQKKLPESGVAVIHMDGPEIARLGTA